MTFVVQAYVNENWVTISNEVTQTGITFDNSKTYNFNITPVESNKYRICRIDTNQRAYSSPVEIQFYCRSIPE